MTDAHSLFQEEKQAYWRLRDSLLQQFSHRWVAIAGGAVRAVGDSADDVMAEAYRQTTARVLYINKVGDEQTALRKKIRRAETLRYSQDYDPPMPMLTTEVSNPESI